ncbi:MAG TPA: hypothetical protein VK724_15945 [Bryobacteraceae bacterium]|nr:hypothetical protein [Bryobacteraceae bacterium]
MRNLCLTFFALCTLASAANFKLYFKDGSDQLVREYKIQNDRLNYYSVDRDEWEEVPLSIVDLDKTKSEIKQRADDARADAAAQDAEDKAERAARKEMSSVPPELGVYLIEEQDQGPPKLTPMKVGESKLADNKRRTLLKVITRVPLAGKSTLELDGAHSSQGTANRTPQFYFRLSEDERFGIVRLSDHKGNRVVEKVTIEPVGGIVEQMPDLVETFRQQLADGLFKIWPQKPLDPGEYAVVEYTEDKINMQVWDFFIAPGAGN